MPSGHVHTIINFSALAAAWIGVTALRLPLPDAALTATFIGTYVIGTLLITPDLDLGEQRVAARNNWGALGWIWIPYGVMSRHRGLNHTYLIGPALRLAYLLLIAAALHALIGSVWPAAAAWRLPALDGPVLLAAAAGYWISQALHLMADGIHPFSELQLRESKS